MILDESTASMTQAEYDALVEERRCNKAARAKALEEARLWCQINKGTATLAEGLRACTPEELMKLYWDYGYVGYWVQAAQQCTEIVRRLTLRQQACKQQRQALADMQRVPWKQVAPDG